MIAYCGLDCHKCEAYVATLNNDDSLRAKVAKDWSELYHAPIKPEHINCTGCRSEGVKTYYCEHMCMVRPCAKEKGIQNCAPCESYPCDELHLVFTFAPHAKTTLDSLKNG